MSKIDSLFQLEIKNILHQYNILVEQLQKRIEVLEIKLQQNIEKEKRLTTLLKQKTHTNTISSREQACKEGQSNTTNFLSKKRKLHQLDSPHTETKQGLFNQLSRYGYC